MTRSFRTALLDALERTETTMAELSRATGVSEEQIKKIKQRENASTNVDDAVLIAHYFGMTLDEFIEDRTAAARVESVELYMQLTPQERDLLAAAASGLRARAKPEEQ